MSFDTGEAVVITPCGDIKADFPLWDEVTGAPPGRWLALPSNRLHAWVQLLSYAPCRLAPTRHGRWRQGRDEEFSANPNPNPDPRAATKSSRRWCTTTALPVSGPQGHGPASRCSALG